MRYNGMRALISRDDLSESSRWVIVRVVCSFKDRTKSLEGPKLEVALTTFETFHLTTNFRLAVTYSHKHTHTHTAVVRVCGFCLGQPGWAGTRRNIHPLTPIVVINSRLSASSIYYDPWHPPCSFHAPDNLFPQSLSKFSLVYSWPGTLHFIFSISNSGLSWLVS